MRKSLWSQRLSFRLHDLQRAKPCNRPTACSSGTPGAVPGRSLGAHHFSQSCLRAPAGGCLLLLIHLCFIGFLPAEPTVTCKSVHSVSSEGFLLLTAGSCDLTRGQASRKAWEVCLGFEAVRPACWLDRIQPEALMWESGPYGAARKRGRPAVPVSSRRWF